MLFRWLNRVDFGQGQHLQAQAVEQILAGTGDEQVLLMEHPHVFTLGRAGDAKNLLAIEDLEGKPIQLVSINRGGDVTYHGPGQLVGYPILDLRQRRRDVHRYLRDLEEALIRTCGDWGVESFRRPGLTGVWTDMGKIASIGVGVRHWITMQGFALNVCPDLRYFSLINPCGIPDCPVTSLSQLGGARIGVEDVLPALQRHLSEVLGIKDGEIVAHEPTA